MASFKPKNSNVYIPEEIMIEILSRLPVKALKRFRCVCKTWPLLIHNPTFISRHLIQSTINSNGGNLLITSQSQTDHSYSDVYMDVFVDGAFDASINSGKVLPSLGLTGYMNIISNNGLLCIDANTYHSYVIWNPTMRLFREIPRDKIVKVDALTYRQFLGFGVLGETNDYKLIRFLDEDVDRMGSVYKYRKLSRGKKMKIYSRLTGLWREINPEDTIYGQFISEDCSHIQVKGVLYWVLIRLEVYPRSYFIMGFEIHEEKFLLLAMPYDHPNYSDCKLTEIEGSLALINFNPKSNSYYVWTMNEHGEGWDMKFTIEALNRSRHVVMGWKNCLVMRYPKRARTSDRSLFSIQRLDGARPMVVQEINNFFVYDKTSYATKVHMYIESLIHV